MQANPAKLAAACMIVANPAAGSVSESLVEQIAGRCARHTGSVRTFWTTKRGDATSEVRDYASSPDRRAGFLVVVAVGGDGTVLEVVKGMVGASTRGYEDHALFVVPAGTGNSNYRALWGELPWPEALDRALSALPDSIARLDLAQVPELRDLVVLGAGAGLSAEVLMSASSIQLAGHARLAAALDRAAARFTPYEGRVTVDGTVLHKGRTVLVNVGGGPYRAWQYTVLPHSLLDDGLLDVCVVSDEICPAQVPGLLLTGAHVRTPGVFYGRGERVVIERLDGAPLCFEHDGELIAGISPRFTVQVLPGALAALCGPVRPTAGADRWRR
jgi:diacylglycerol kinase (ATP)